MRLGRIPNGSRKRRGVGLGEDDNIVDYSERTTAFYPSDKLWPEAAFIVGAMTSVIAISNFTDMHQALSCPTTAIAYPFTANSRH
jgi:hypothetical protein